MPNQVNQQHIELSFLELKGQIELLKQQLDSSSKRVEKFTNAFDGTDPNSFSSRITTTVNQLHTKYFDIDQRYATINERLDEIDKDIKIRTSADISGNWLLKTTIIAALITGIFSCIGHIINWNKPYITQHQPIIK